MDNVKSLYAENLNNVKSIPLQTRMYHLRKAENLFSKQTGQKISKNKT